MVPDASCTSRPPRPNSIEVKRNYPSGYSSEEIYAAQRNSSARSPQDNTYRSVHLFHFSLRLYLIYLLINFSVFILPSLAKKILLKDR